MEIKKIKYVIFDCWDTVIKLTDDYYFEYFKICYENIKNKEKMSFTDFVSFSKDFFENYYKNATYEVPQENILRYLFEVNNLIPLDSYYNIGLKASTSYKVSKTDNIDKFIEFLKENNIKCSILSNTIHEDEITKKIILSKYDSSTFEHIISSSTYGVRKPMFEFFSLASKKINVDRENIAYIGDNFEFDVRGSYLANMNSFYYNWKNVHAYDSNIDYIEFKDYLDLINIFKKGLKNG